MTLAEWGNKEIMVPHENENRQDDIAKQCVNLGGAITLVSFLLLYLQPSWPAAAGIVGLCAMGSIICFVITRVR